MATPSSIRRLACSSSGSRQTRCLHDTVTRATSSPTSHASRTSSSTPPSQRSFATAPYTSSEPESEEIRPRWQSTPRGMTMPFRIRPMDKNNQWRVNDDPKKLNDFYVRMLGPGGDSLLSEETKWLAVTHKSFDQGKRGFNDRLSYFGKRVLSLQTSLALLASPPGPILPQTEGAYERQPFEHPLLESLPHLTAHAKAGVLAKSRLSHLGKEYGLQGVLRWKPKKADNLSGSGIDLVTAQAVYAIIGAISLERGGEIANRIAREQILRPLGLEVR